MYVQLYDSVYNTVGNDAYLSNSTRFISLSVITGQEYYVRVRPSSSSGKGTYKIGFSESGVTPGSTVTELTADTWAGGDIPETSDEQWFKFTATAATQNIHAEWGTLTYMYVQAYDSGYNAVGSEAYLHDSTRFTSLSVITGQEYYVRVRSGSHKGTYKIKYNSSLTPPEAVTALAADTWAGGNIANSNGDQWFKFTATAAAQYIHAEFDTLTRLYVVLYDSANNTVGSAACLSNTGALTSSFSVSVTVGQEYHIRVWPASGSGTYKIKYNASAAPGAAVTRLTENTWADGDIPETDGDQWFKFTATAATQYIHAETGTLTSMYVQVYDSGYNAVGDRATLYSSTRFTSRTLTTGQEYYIRVWPNTTNGKGTYKIGFNKYSLLPAPSSAATLTANTWADGNIPSAGGEQWFKFTATAATQYIHAGFSTLTDLYVWVCDSGYNTVGNATQLNGATRFTSRTVTAGQDYYIRVRPSYSTGKGTYKIEFSESFVTPGAAVTRLTADTWADGNIPAVGGEQWFKFTATAATQYIHAEWGTMTGLNIQVYDSGYNAVGDPANLYNSIRVASLTVIAGQEYYIRVWSYHTTGTYKVKFNEIIVPPETVITPLTADTWVDGNIPSAGGEQWFKFTATVAAQNIHADFGTLTSMYVQVYDSGYTAVGNTTRLYSSTRFTSRTLTAGQDYYIQVLPYSNYKGTYKIGFNKSPILPETVIPLTPGTVIPQLTAGAWADGDIPSAGGEQWYKFTATAAAQNIHAEFGTLTSMYVQVYDSGYTAVGDRANLYSATRFTSRTVIAGQEYYIRVSPYSSTGKGTYKIGFNESPIAPETVIPQLTANTWADGNIPSVGGEHWYKFTATAAAQYIHAERGTLIGLYIQVYDSGYTAVGDEIRLSDSTRFISRILNAGWEYYVRVLNNNTGTYKIGFSESPILPETVITPLTADTWADGDIPSAGGEHGNIPSSGREQWFKFTATAAAQNIHAEFGTLTDLYVRVYDSGYNVVGNATQLNGSTRFASLTVIAGQEYYIRVSPYSSTGKGTYKIGFNQSDAMPGSTVTQLTADTWTDGNIPSAGGDQWYKFTATAATQNIHAEFGTLTDLYVQLYDSGYTTVGNRTNLFSSTRFTSRTLTAGQDYYIQVWPYSSTGKGTYKIGFNETAVPPETEVTPLTADTWADGNIPAVGGEQWFKFTATATRQYIHAQFGTLTSLNVRVYRGGGMYLNSDLTGSERFDSFGGAVTGQDCYVWVRPYSSTGKGTYKLAFNESGVPPGETVTQLTAGAWADGSIPETGGEQWFKFTATAAVQIIHAEPGTLTALSVQLYDRSFNAVESETNLDGSTRFTSRTVTAGQEYHIRVQPASGTGTYKIGFNESGASPGAVVTALAADTWVAGNIPAAGDEQWFSFTAAAAAHYLHFEYGSLDDLQVQLYDSAYNTVDTEDRMSGTTNYIRRLVTDGGTYYVRVRPYSSSASGTYRIGLTEYSSPPR